MMKDEIIKKASKLEKSSQVFEETKNMVSDVLKEDKDLIYALKNL